MKKILCIHGIGGKDATMDKWSKDWTKAIKDHSGFSEEPEFHYLRFDDLFTKSKERMGGIQYARAVWKFIASWVSTAVTERERSKGFADTIGWYAGMPAQFATDAQLRNDLHKLLAETIADFKPDLIFAHSLGSLICYDYFRQEAAAKKSSPIMLLTAGSQIGHPAMRTLFGGVILPLNVKYWINLRNENDLVFASRSIAISSDLYLELPTPFHHGMINHEAVEYLTNPVTVARAWPMIAGMAAKAAVPLHLGSNELARAFKPSNKIERKPKRKALLIGINDYPDEASRLEGCVNDVYRISEVLQEYGFSPNEIRVALNERATAKGIRERMEWLLDDARPGDLSLFFYSGHGAQIPSSHSEYEIDCNDECLVPYDFDWSVEHAYTDKEFLQLYAQLSLDVNFISILDCCHSGGMTRGNGSRPKGLTPPDDIRHREIKWNETHGMWIERDLNISDTLLFKDKQKDTALYNGSNGRTNRLGRAIPLWTDVKSHEKAKKTYGVKSGAYMPVILEACSEHESAYEYRHGVTSYGAFTYSLTNLLRKRRAAGMPLTFEQLVKDSSKLLKALNYDQTPVLVGPKVRTKGELPFPKL